MESQSNLHESPPISAVLERFRKTQARIDAQKSVEEFERSDEKRKQSKVPVIQAEGLGNLPQPELSESSVAKPTLEWPVEPTFVDPKKTASFASLGVSSPTIERLSGLGINHAFAVQCTIIPRILQCQRKLAPDPLPSILVNSFTGSGKTLAYAVPVIDLLRTRRVGRIRCLILLPTKVLIQQVCKVLEQLASGTPVRVLALKSDRTLSKEAQLLTQTVPDIVVSAPGRLVDHLNLNPDLLADLQLLIVDEADRLVGQSFQNWTTKLKEKLPLLVSPPAFQKGSESLETLPGKVWRRPVQRLVFSATLTRDPAKLADLQITAHDQPCLPEIYVVGDQQLNGKDEFALPRQLDEKLIKCRSLGDKPLVLTHELLQCDGKVLVFTNSNESAARLARLINLVSHQVFGRSLSAQRCSGEMRAQDRRKILREFEDLSSGVLVCTDLIARGIDMEIDTVINYDVPQGAREYVHRVGRTARAGASGQAWTLVTLGSDLKKFWEIQALVGRVSNIIEEVVEPECDDQRYQAALKELGQEVRGHQ